MYIVSPFAVLGNISTDIFSLYIFVETYPYMISCLVSFHLKNAIQITQRIFRVNLIANFYFIVNWSDKHPTAQPFTLTRT